MQALYNTGGKVAMALVLYQQGTRERKLLHEALNHVFAFNMMVMPAKREGHFLAWDQEAKQRNDQATELVAGSAEVVGNAILFTQDDLTAMLIGIAMQIEGGARKAVSELPSSFKLGSHLAAPGWNYAMLPPIASTFLASFSAALPDSAVDADIKYPNITVARKGRRRPEDILVPMSTIPPVRIDGHTVAALVVGYGETGKKILGMTYDGGETEHDIGGIFLWSEAEGWSDKATGWRALVTAVVNMLDGVRFEKREIPMADGTAIRYVGHIPQQNVQAVGQQVMEAQQRHELGVQSRKDLREKTIEGYLNTLQSFGRMAQGRGKLLSEGARHQQASRYLYAQLSRARLYEFDPFVLTKATQQVLTEMAAELPLSQTVTKELLDARMAEQPPVTGKRPHPVMYMAFGVGVELQSSAAEQVTQHVRELGGEVTGTLYVYAYLVTPEIVSGLFTDMHKTFTISMFEQGRWGYSTTLAAWLVPHLIEIINDQNARVTLESGLGLKTAWKGKAKKLKVKRPMPPPFYTVQVSHWRDRKPRGQGPGNSVQREHVCKHAVDAHTRLLVQRGTLPLDRKLKADLLKRRYSIFEARAGNDVQRELIGRKHPPQREGEWIATRRVWIREHVSPKRDDLPLVQGVKKVKRA